MLLSLEKRSDYLVVQVPEDYPLLHLGLGELFDRVLARREDLFFLHEALEERRAIAIASTSEEPLTLVPRVSSPDMYSATPDGTKLFYLSDYFEHYCRASASLITSARLSSPETIVQDMFVSGTKDTSETYKTVRTVLSNGSYVFPPHAYFGRFFSTIYADLAANDAVIFDHVCRAENGTATEHTDESDDSERPESWDNNRKRWNYGPTIAPHTWEEPIPGAFVQSSAYYRFRTTFYNSRHAFYHDDVLIAHAPGKSYSMSQDARRHPICVRFADLSTDKAERIDTPKAFAVVTVNHTVSGALKQDVPSVSKTLLVPITLNVTTISDILPTVLSLAGIVPRTVAELEALCEAAEEPAPTASGQVVNQKAVTDNLNITVSRVIGIQKLSFRCHTIKP